MEANTGTRESNDHGARPPEAPKAVGERADDRALASTSDLIAPAGQSPAGQSPAGQSPTDASLSAEDVPLSGALEASLWFG